ncbi:hypothetical protein [Microbacterium sp. cx-59]|uniref:hypothetical protein n=1 Tax=Microbacterium sp. cx-59 TaxID=2891207 RepID=UPI001E2D5DF7|nr:hypothetical protein [Microbacterium sp. cx-59]MCC4908019.1 hypothetical protein [Microbacterium sp. cx-59]
MDTEVSTSPAPPRHRPTRAVIVVALTAVGALIGVAVALGIGGGFGGGPASESAPTVAGQNAPDGETADASERRGPAPGATPVDGSEVLPPTSGEDPNRIPPREADPPIVSAPLPAAASASGHLVTGFPASVVGPATGDDVIDSSVSPEGTTLQVTLTARSDRGADEIRTHFRELWASFGLLAREASVQNQLFASDTASVTLDVVETGTGTVYSLFATLRTE